MSFGVGFGDIAKAIGLAKDVVTRYREAPKHMNDLATEVSARLNILKTANSALQHCHDTSKSEALRPILEGYITLLDRLRRIYDDNNAIVAPGHSFRSKAGVFGRRLTFDANDIKGCRDQIGHYNGMLDSFMTSLNVAMAEEAAQSREREEILNWLNPPRLDSPQGLDSRFGETHTERLRRRVGETGDWLQKLTEFQNFIEKPQNMLLCLGNPGVGKSVLSSIAIHYLQELQAASTSSIGVGFIILDFKSQDEPEDIIACLLGQLLRHKKVPSDLQDLFRLYKLKPKRSLPLMGELVVRLKTVISSYSRTFVVIDALDECTIRTRRVFLKNMFELQKVTNLNVFATLRPILEIIALFDSSGVLPEKIQIDAREDDIRRFLDCRMDESMPCLDSVVASVKNDLVSDIAKASAGVFLLAELYLQSITKCQTVAAIQDTIQRLPTGTGAYDKLYADTMKRIRGKCTVDLAMHILSWVGWARRPLTLRELQHALAFIEGKVILDNNNTTSEESIVSVCEGLVTIDKEPRIIRLIHFTTREYLEGVAPEIFPTVQCDILDVCLGLISSSAFQTGRCQTNEEFAARLSKYPLYDYAVKNWGLHARLIASIRDAEILTVLQNNSIVEAANQGLLTWAGFSQHTPAKVSGLHLAVWFGLTTTAGKLLSRGFYSANERNTYGQSALAMAASKGHLDIVKVLLAYTAEVDTNDNMSRTPLSLAAERGDVEMVKILMNHSADVCRRDMFGRSPLSYAAESGSEATVKRLLSHARSMTVTNHPDQTGKTPVWYAALRKHWGIVKELVAHQANIDFHDKHGTTLVAMAAEIKQWDDVMEVIKAGADVNLPNAAGRTLLSSAAEHCRGDITEALLGRNADQAICDGDGWTPLMWASDSGWDAGVLMLLQHSHDCLERQDRHGQTALSIASSMGHTAVVELLLDWDSQRKALNLADKTGWTPLIQAAKNGSDVLGLILDKAGSAVETTWRDVAGKTALHWAAARGHLKAVKRLVTVVGLDLEGADNLQRTALWLAAANGHSDVVATLLANGVAVNVADCLQRTPLRIAAERGQEEVVKELLRWKGDLGTELAPRNDIQALVCFTVSLGVRHALEASGVSGHDGLSDVLGLVALFS